MPAWERLRLSLAALVLSLRNPFMLSSGSCWCLRSSARLARSRSLTASAACRPSWALGKSEADVAAAADQADGALVLAAALREVMGSSRCSYQRPFLSSSTVWPRYTSAPIRFCSASSSAFFSFSRSVVRPSLRLF